VLKVELSRLSLTCAYIKTFHVLFLKLTSKNNLNTYNLDKLDAVVHKGHLKRGRGFSSHADASGWVGVKDGCPQTSNFSFIIPVYVLLASFTSDAQV